MGFNSAFKGLTVQTQISHRFSRHWLEKDNVNQAWNIHNSLEQSHSLEASSFQKFSVLYETQRFIAVFIYPCPLADGSSPHPANPISLLSIPTLSSHLRQGLSSGLFPSRFPIKIPYAFITHVCPCPSRLILIPLTPQQYLVRNTYQAVSHFIVFSSLMLFLLYRPKYFHQQPILEHPQPRHILFP